ncbi:MDM20 N-terminal acetyltransferase B complex subunit MDM20 [Candida maltosa Xu316]|uniref:N-terminal acetyltransferase B complex subunit MDM20 n=1 Tax=Candida maltosa (strain Xu316) TaxID=1245528 RepID=M3J2A0_CANMX|nr:hypothetical protein G210_3787 [Candida maltosa Xu316]
MASNGDQEIIEFIDQGNYNYAQTLLAKKIAKFPQRSLYYALQNKIHYKLGQKDKAIKSNIELMNKQPNDLVTIETLSNFFDEAGMEKESNSVYENAIKKYPVSAEKLCLNWFDKSIEKYDFKLLNRIFMYLNKNQKSRLYTLWYAFSFHLLLKDGEKEKEGLYKSLGKKLVQNLEPFENTQEIYVYTLFLDNTEIEQVLGNITLPLDLELKLRYMDSMEKNGNFEKLHSYTQNLLFNESFDDFDTWKLWIVSGQKIGKTFDQLNDKLTGLTRNILLLKIELHQLYGKDIDSSVEAYYNKFNNKLCCFQDLSKYQLPSSFTDLTKQPSDQLITLVNNRKFENQVNNWDIYEKFHTKTGAEFDSNPVNELTLRSIVADLDSSPEKIVKNISIITHLLKDDKYNYKLKLWLMKLYSQLNTNDLIFPVYLGMKIKMVQHETLNYYLTTSGSSKTSLDNFIDIYRFYLTSRQEIRDSITQGFDNGVYNKLESTINFGKRIQNSISLNFAVAKILQISLITGTDGYLNYFIGFLKERESFILSDFTDNRDFSTEWNGLDKKDDVASIPLNDISVKLKLLIYSIIFTASDPSKLLKLYNKLVSNHKFSPFDNLLYKLYFNLLKITKNSTSNAQETQSLFNYLQKNLKTDKLKILIPENVMSSELNQNLANLVEFLKIVKLLSKKHQSSYMNQLVGLSKPLGKEFKELDLVQRQTRLIDDMTFEVPFKIDVDSVKSDIKNSIEDSTSILLNSLSNI